MRAQEAAAGRGGRAALPGYLRSALPVPQPGTRGDAAAEPGEELFGQEPSLGSEERLELPPSRETGSSGAFWREKRSQLAAGTCEIVTLDRDSSQPRRTIARQTARCACRKGQIAGTTRARPACVDARIIKTKQWCDMLPCLEGEGCDLLINRSGWTCTQPGGRIKTTTVGS
ncbi:chemokine-like protein TAFA-5 isoform X1 [Macaca fascicularis]|uniref:chemokine-like protein TAFA-5 isoform X1 n=1 Tax=Macaca fascicularis TaxID=9541 RepID=UPI0032B04C11